MKLTIPRDRLIEALALVTGVVSTRTTLPILGNVLIQATDGKVSLSATDLDASMSTSAPADVTQPGEITLPARRMLALTRELDNGNVSLEMVDGGSVSIKGGRAVFKLKGLSADEFASPEPFTSAAQKSTVDQAALRAALTRTSFAVSTDESRYVLNGALFRFTPGKLTIVCTDGRRLAMDEITAQGEAQGDLIIPSKAVAELMRLAKKGALAVEFDQGRASFSTETDTLTTKLIEGSYPNYKQVIPSETTATLEVNREALIGAVNRVALLTNERTAAVKLGLSASSLLIHSNTAEVGEADEKIDCSFKGEPFDIHFNPAFLVAPLRQLDTERITLNFARDGRAPMVIREPMTYVLMPCAA